MRVDDAQRRMQQVAVLGVLQAEERAVGGEAAAEEAAWALADPDEVGRAVELAHVAAARDIDREAVAVANARGDDAGRLRQAVAPAVRHAVEERSALAAGERLEEPEAGLVTRLVVEPEDALAVQRRQPVDDADAALSHLAPLPRRRVPRVQLPDARLARGVRAALGCVRRPLRQERDRRAEA